MNKYNWEEFVKDAYFNELVNFYLNILGLNDSYKIDWNNILFLSEKSFEIYLLLVDKKIIDEKKCKVKIYHSSYIINNIKENLFENENLCIVDDTMLELNYITEIFNKIITTTSVNKIYSKIFMLSNELDYDFLQIPISISSLIIEEPSKIISFSIKERVVCHNSLVPYTSTLPIISINGKRSFELTEKEFDQIKNNYNWDYIEVKHYNDTKYEITNATLILKNSGLINIHQEFIHSLTIQLQIVRTKDKYFLTAISSPLLNSVNFEDLYKLFNRLYASSEYGKAIKKILDEKTEISVYEKIYNAVKYTLSLETAYQFKNNLTEIDSNLKPDILYKNNQYSYCEDVLKTNDDFFKNKHLETLIKIMSTNDFSIKYLNLFGMNKFEFIGVESLFLVISRIVEKLKYIENDNGNKNFVSLDDLENYILESYYGYDVKKLKMFFISYLNSFVEQHNINNTLLYNPENNNVYNGFVVLRENELLYNLETIIFYNAIHEYYQNIDKDIYSKNYDRFIAQIIIFLKDNRLYDIFFDKEKMLFLKDMFKTNDKSNIFNSIKDKEDLLLEIDAFYIKKIKSYTKKLDLY